jgi:hypothetical protein
MAESKNLNPIIYMDSNKESIEVFIEDDTAWATQSSMAKILGIDVSEITKHLKSVFDSRELDQDSNVQKMHIANSSKPVQFYSLDTIISVGYRVNSQKATKFRVWANGILKQYIRDGYVINEAMLRESPEKLNELAAKLRELRASEKNIFSSVREVFKIAATDYEPSSKKVRSFYALLQDKFHHAVTSMPAAKLILDRADHSLENMGVVSKSGITPTKLEALVGKNYLTDDEMYRLHLLAEQFLLYAESTALRGQQKTMDELHQKLDDLLAFNEYPVMPDYPDYLRGKVDSYVEQEYEQYIQIKKLEHLGVDVDLEAFYEGEYDNYRHETSKIRMQEVNKALREKEKSLKIENDGEKSISPFNASLKTALNYNPKD